MKARNDGERLESYCFKEIYPFYTLIELSLNYFHMVQWSMPESTHFSNYTLTLFHKKPLARVVNFHWPQVGLNCSWLLHRINSIKRVVYLPKLNGPFYIDDFSAKKKNMHELSIGKTSLLNHDTCFLPSVEKRTF